MKTTPLLKLCTEILPLCFSIMFFTMFNPKPLPSPASFVVKKGSKILSIISSEIPVPSSAMDTLTYSALFSTTILILPFPLIARIEL